MHTLDRILTKKDYSRKTPASLFYKDSPLWQKLLTIGCVVFWPVPGWESETNQQRSGRPSQSHLSGGDRAGNAVHPVLPGRKASPGVMEAYPALYVPDGGAVFLVDGHLDRKLCRSVFHDRSCSRSCSRVLPSSLPWRWSICSGKKAIELFTISICIANTAIMLLSIPGYGFAASIQSLVTCLITFGDADGYALQLEIHDLTFVFGQMILYYAVLLLVLPGRKSASAVCICCSAAGFFWSA